MIKYEGMPITQTSKVTQEEAGNENIVKVNLELETSYQVFCAFFFSFFGIRD
jgi:hypothetical protein